MEDELERCYILDCTHCGHSWGFEEDELITIETVKEYVECPNCQGTDFKITPLK